MDLAEWMYRKRLGCVEVAKMADLSESHVRSLAAGRYLPTKKTAIKIYHLTEGAVRMKYGDWIYKPRRLSKEDVVSKVEAPADNIHKKEKE